MTYHEVVLERRPGGVVVSAAGRSWPAPDPDVVDLGTYLSRFGPVETLVLRGVLDRLARPDLAVRSAIETVPVAGRLVIEHADDDVDGRRSTPVRLDEIAAQLGLRLERIGDTVVLTRARTGPVPRPTVYGPADAPAWPPRPDRRTPEPSGDAPVLGSRAVSDPTERLDALAQRDEVIGVSAEIATLRARIDDLVDRVQDAEATAARAAEEAQRCERYVETISADLGAAPPGSPAPSPEEIREMQATLERRSVQYVLRLTKWVRGS
jgi:hypothetical protein